MTDTDGKSKTLSHLEKAKLALELEAWQRAREEIDAATAIIEVEWSTAVRERLLSYTGPSSFRVSSGYHFGGGGCTSPVAAAAGDGKSYPTTDT